ncbi:MAG: hypothetical protein GY723_07610 [bacterium]|nr:hypothetical protein [bacterium]
MALSLLNLRFANPIQLAGGYFHLQPMVLMQSPGCTDRGTRVEVERAKSA